MRKFRYIIIAFFIIAAIWVFIFILKNKYQSLIDTYFGSGFLTSYSASLLEDIIFFGFIGFAALIISTKRPEDDDYDNRIKSLANNKQVGDKARFFLSDLIKELLAYSSRQDVRLVIKDYDVSTNCIKLFSDYNGEIINMCKDLHFPIFDMYFSIEPNECVNNNYGHISYLGIIDNKSNQKQILVEREIYEFKDKSPYKKSFNIEISGNSSANWQMSFVTWGKLDTERNINDNWYFVKVKNYTESVTVVIDNETTNDFKCDIRYVNRNNNKKGEKVETSGINIKSQSKNTILGNNVVFHPQDKFEIFFYKQ